MCSLVCHLDPFLHLYFFGSSQYLKTPILSCAMGEVFCVCVFKFVFFYINRSSRSSNQSKLQPKYLQEFSNIISISSLLESSCSTFDRTSKIFLTLNFSTLLFIVRLNFFCKVHKLLSY